LKYALTVGGPLVVVAAALSPNPLAFLVTTIVVVAPFGGFSATLAGTEIPVLVPLLLLASAAAVAGGGVAPRLSALGAAAVAATALLALPIAQGADPGAGAVWLASMLAVGWLSARAAATPGGLRLVVGGLVASGALQGLIALWEFRTGHRLNLYGTAGTPAFGADYFFGFSHQDRPTGAFYDPISLGNVLALSAPLALALTLTARGVWARSLPAIGGLCAAVGLTLSLSRMSWIAAGVGLLVTLALLPRGGRGRSAATSVALVVAAIAAGGALVGPALNSRFDSIGDPTSSRNTTARGDRLRVQLWHAAADVAVSNPVAGAGVGALEPQLERRVAGAKPGMHAHSTYLEVAAEAGLLGVVALAILLSALVRDVWRGLRAERALVAGMAGAAVAMLVGWLSDYTIRYSAVAVTAAALLGAIAAAGRGRAHG
jgi:O-antigen ligase